MFEGNCHVGCGAGGPKVEEGAARIGYCQRTLPDGSEVEAVGGAMVRDPRRFGRMRRARQSDFHVPRIEERYTKENCCTAMRDNSFATNSGHGRMASLEMVVLIPGQSYDTPMDVDDGADRKHALLNGSGDSE